MSLEKRVGGRDKAQTQSWEYLEIRFKMRSDVKRKGRGINNCVLRRAEISESCSSRRQAAGSLGKVTWTGKGIRMTVRVPST